MVSRNLTEVYVLMRNNAIQGRQIYSDQSVGTDRVHLMSSREIEQGDASFNNTSLPPEWTNSLEEAQYILSRLRSKITDLKELQRDHIHRPKLDEIGAEEQRVSRLTGELSRLFTTAHKLVQVINSQGRLGSKSEQRLANNVVQALVKTLQELSQIFRSAQSSYIKTLTNREQRSNVYFELPNFDQLDMSQELLPGLTSDHHTDTQFVFGPSSSGLKNNENSSAFFVEEDLDEVFQRPALNQKQLQAFQEVNTMLAEEREREVNKIVKSVLDLNDIFKDLAHMVHEQGTVLDRIDYNVEIAQMQVREGYSQLRKADRYHRANRKMKCIFVLGIVIIVLAVLLVVVKS